MSTWGQMLWLLSNLKGMLPGIVTMGVVTVAAVIVLAILSTFGWVDSKSFVFAGLFFGLKRRGILQLACSWLKLIFVLVFLVAFQKMDLTQYMMLIIPGIVLALTLRRMEIVTSLIWLLLQVASMFSVNSVCGYLRDMHPSKAFILVYVALALFLAMFSIYLFFTEIDMISENRNIDPENI